MQNNLEVTSCQKHFNYLRSVREQKRKRSSHPSQVANQPGLSLAKARSPQLHARLPRGASHYGTRPTAAAFPGWPGGSRISTWPTTAAFPGWPGGSRISTWPTAAAFPGSPVAVAGIQTAAQVWDVGIRSVTHCTTILVSHFDF